MQATNVGAVDGRDELASTMEFIQPGDELAAGKPGRLGRSTRDVRTI
jgi:DNA invertase Pin-like site-specific DNA recombinase